MSKHFILNPAFIERFVTQTPLSLAEVHEAIRARISNVHERIFIADPHGVAPDKPTKTSILSFLGQEFVFWVATPPGEKISEIILRSELTGFSDGRRKTDLNRLATEGKKLSEALLSKNSPFGYEGGGSLEQALTIACQNQQPVVQRHISLDAVNYSTDLLEELQDSIPQSRLSPFHHMGKTHEVLTMKFDIEWQLGFEFTLTVAMPAKSNPYLVLTSLDVGFRNSMDRKNLLAAAEGLEASIKERLYCL